MQHSVRDSGQTFLVNECLSRETKKKRSIFPPIASFVSLSRAKPTCIYNTFWYFAAERQKIFYRKIAEKPPPWSADKIISTYKFTNAYRASDRVSQYLIRKVIYQNDQSTKETFFRIVLFKIFNRINTWELLMGERGTISYSDYAFEKYDSILTKALLSGGRIYSAAYIMPSGVSAFGHRRKHRNHLRLIEMLMRDEVPLRVAEMNSMKQVFDLLRSYPMIGDFLAYQLAIDINYSNIMNFSEMDFVMPGPGARSGIRKCFSDYGDLCESDLIRMMADRQAEEFSRLGLNFQSLWGRPLQLIDCQNIFCETDKYSRVAHPHVKTAGHRQRIKQIYRPGKGIIEYWYPPKWKINELVSRREKRQ